MLYVFSVFFFFVFFFLQVNPHILFKYILYFIVAVCFCFCRFVLCIYIFILYTKNRPLHFVGCI